MNDNEEHSNGFWFGLAIGGLLGAAASYLATTDEVERKKLLKKGKLLLENLEEFGGNVGEQVEEKVEKVTKLIEKKAPEMVEVASDTVGDTADDVKKIAQEAIEKITASVENLEKTAKKVEKKGFANVFLRGGRPVIKR
ncbi:MAG: hypothetical protein M1514_03845 [Patescibacteria group bacterium]|nr:hypothetical protein [Patescibacteria group bacterium]